MKGEYKGDIECDEIYFANSWWAVFTKSIINPKTLKPYNVTVAAVPAEHITLIECIDP